MKEQYIKQVEKALHVPCKAKREIVRDLNEIFASAAEHGETEQQVVQRLGAPREFADCAAEPFGVDNSSLRKRKGFILSLSLSLSSFAITAAAFALCAAAKAHALPAGVIGQADAMTNIQVEGAFAFDASRIFLAAGIISAVLAVIQMIRTVRDSRRYV